jgi:hypothetical protein
MEGVFWASQDMWLCTAVSRRTSTITSRRTTLRTGSARSATSSRTQSSDARGTPTRVRCSPGQQGEWALPGSWLVVPLAHVCPRSWFSSTTPSLGTCLALPPWRAFLSVRLSDSRVCLLLPPSVRPSDSPAFSLPLPGRPGHDVRGYHAAHRLSVCLIRIFYVPAGRPGQDVRGGHAVRRLSV